MVYHATLLLSGHILITLLVLHLLSHCEQRCQGTLSCWQDTVKIGYIQFVDVHQLPSLSWTAMPKLGAPNECVYPPPCRTFLPTVVYSVYCLVSTPSLVRIAMPSVLKWVQDDPKARQQQQRYQAARQQAEQQRVAVQKQAWLKQSLARRRVEASRQQQQLLLRSRARAFHAKVDAIRSAIRSCFLTCAPDKNAPHKNNH